MRQSIEWWILDQCWIEPPRPLTPRFRSSESTKVNHIPNFQIIIIQQFLHITLNSNSNKSEILIAEKLDERVGEVSGVDELEDEAASTHAELESGN